MATLRPFRALRPHPDKAAQVAAVPYDVVDVDEARALAEGNPLSFLRVSRPELELPAGADPHADAVYARAAQNFRALADRAFVVEPEPSLYFYRLRMGSHVQLGLAGVFSIDEYDADIIRKHERTRRDKEDDRTRHMIALGAQTGPVFLTYKASPSVDAIASRAVQSTPLLDFTASDGVAHTMWRIDGANRDALVTAFGHVPVLYIADGHHRAASAARARTYLRQHNLRPEVPGFGEADYVLAVAFPDDQVQILSYNRVVRDLAGLAVPEFLDRVREHFDVAAGPAMPARPGEMSMYLGGRWYTLRAHVPPDRSDAIGSLDVSILQDRLLAPVLKIADVRTDDRIDFVGGARGTAALERRVNAGGAAVAFSLFPVSVGQLMAVADAGAIMPPKSTWFEPKLRDGLLIHAI
jgi:uncharacterized protein (DUF1015 family)